jgi:hypothetical protein
MAEMEGEREPRKKKGGRGEATDEADSTGE